MPVTVRQATVADAVVLARLINQFDGTSATPEQVATRMQSCANFLTTWLGVLDGQVAGFACLRLLPQLQVDAPHAELTDLYVDPPFRRHGVARALIAHVHAAAQDAAAHEVLLITDFTNVAGQAAYRAAGYADYALAMRKSFADQPMLGPPPPEA
jgi:ribosomal protein S18 acetylase RimI-like enzyme